MFFEAHARTKVADGQPKLKHADGDEKYAVRRGSDARRIWLMTTKTNQLPQRNDSDAF